MNEDRKPIAIRIELLRSPQPFDPLRRKFETLTIQGRWREIADTPAAIGTVDDEFQRKFHVYWTEVGSKIREQIDDDEKLRILLRKMLPPYSGPERTLFRGENLDRWKTERIGLCWSEDKETASMFAEGLNAMRSGGVLLTCYAPASSIIAGPSSHSLYLGEHEYTLDVTRLRKIRLIQKFPPVS